MYRSSGTRWYKDSKAVAWETEALIAIKLQKRGQLKVKGDTVHITWYRADKRRFDCDGPIKPMLDVLVKAGVMEDDSLVTFLQVQKKQSSLKKHYAEVEVQ